MNMLNLYNNMGRISYELIAVFLYRPLALGPRNIIAVDSRLGYTVLLR